MRWRTAGIFAALLGLFLAGTSLLCAKKKPPAKPVDLNTASEAQLQEVPGIGPVTAKKIVQMRKSYGPFKSVDDLLAIKGIGPKRLDKMRKYLTVGKPEAAKNSQRGSALTSKQPAKTGESPSSKKP